MPLIIIDGPEKAGKSTLIKNLVHPDVQVTHWGPVDSVYAYFEPLNNAIRKASTGEWIIWDRSWASEYVYNDLLGRRDNIIDAFDLLEQMCEANGVIRLGVFSPVELLEKRRTEDDLPVKPKDEAILYRRYFSAHNWIVYDHIFGDK